MKSTQNKNTRKHNPLGIIALIMGCIYMIPLILYILTRIPITLTLSIFLTPIAVISLITAKINFWKSPAENVRITYYGHMCFRLECDGQSVIIDPYRSGSVPGLKDVRGKTQCVLRTSNRDDTGGEIAIKHANDPLPFNIEELEMADGSGKMHLLDNGAHRFVHLGRLSCELTDEQKEAFKGADVLMVPVGGGRAIDSDKAAELTLELLPDYVIPMYYRAEKYGLQDIGTANSFGTELGNRWYELKERLEEQDGDEAEIPKRPVAARLAARNGKEKGYSSVEIRDRNNR